jgi:hypothetical protein
VRSVGPIGAVALLLALSAPTLARAESGVVAVLPLSAGHRAVRLYERPVAAALVQRLRAELDLPVELVSPTGALPGRIELVVDGRIAAEVGPGNRWRVALEVRVRDPVRGTAGATVASRTAPLAEIDRLVTELAVPLAAALRQAAAARRTRSDPAVASRPVPAPARPRHGPAARRMAIFEAAPPASDPAAAPVLTAAARQLANRLGHAAVPAAGRGVVAPAQVRRELARTGARYGLLLASHGLEFRWRGVLTARGAVRVILVDRSAHPLFDRTLRTATLVGQRGDGRGALIHLLSVQLVDIAGAELRRVLARHRLAAPPVRYRAARANVVCEPGACDLM